MAKEASADVKDSPQLAHFRQREQDLQEKLKRITAHPETKDHDLKGSEERTRLALKQVKEEIGRLSK